MAQIKLLVLLVTIISQYGHFLIKYTVPITWRKSKKNTYIGSVKCVTLFSFSAIHTL